MKNYLHAHLTVALYLLGIVVAILSGVIVIDYNQREIASQVEQKLTAQKAYLLELAEIIDRNGADETISRIMSDCPQRTEYENLLNSLGTLQKKDLVTAQVLFENCGNFFTEQKALMVSKLEREIQMYSDFLALYSTLGKDASPEHSIEQWNELLVLEQARSTLLVDQQKIQARIITLLISGSTARSKDVLLLVNDAQQMSDLLSVDDHQIDEIREHIK